GHLPTKLSLPLLGGFRGTAHGVMDKRELMSAPDATRRLRVDKEGRPRRSVRGGSGWTCDTCALPGRRARWPAWQGGCAPCDHPDSSWRACCYWPPAPRLRPGRTSAASGSSTHRRATSARRRRQAASLRRSLTTILT